jgi:histidine decarboxylase
MAETNTGSLLSAEDERRLEDLYAMIRAESETSIGYPCSALFDYTPLYRFLGYPVNNVGDPFVPSNFHLNTHDFECEVLEIFQRLTHAPPDSFWGYVTSGGTEGNMYGIFLARELYPDGLVYFSEDTHYSVAKILRCLRVRNVMIKSDPDGRIDLEDLRETIRIHRDVPPIIFANVGTTMKGAVDDLEGIHGILRDLTVRQRYIHADAALAGMILPFVDDPQPWDFRAGIDSISISGHKMIGSPLPCGVAVADKRNVDRIARRVEYVGTLDTTIAGSRNAITPLFLWYAFRTVGLEGFRRRIRSCLEVADYAVERLNRIGRGAWRHRNSVTVVFDRPSAELVGRWQLAVQGELAHLITMPHVTREIIDRVVDDVAGEAANAAAEVVDSEPADPQGGNWKR